MTLGTISVKNSYFLNVILDMVYMIWTFNIFMAEVKNDLDT